MPVYGLLGKSLKHSWSVPIHQALGCDSYRLIELQEDQLEPFLHENEIGGLNVTVPYKKTVIPFCSTLDEYAREIGSVNTLVPDGKGGIKGFNTDAAGLAYIAKRTGVVFSGAKVLILGSGGTSLTAQAVARREGAAEVVVVSRTGENNYGNLCRHQDADVLINTTPVGMYPNNGECLVSLRDFPGLRAVLDVIYNPQRTALLIQAEKLGIPCSCGLPMLVAQAVRAEEIFFDRKIADEAVEKITADLRRNMLNIVLIGMPGSGKSTVGKELAELTGRQIIDIDAEIEKRAGCTIPELFQREGEGFFREMEMEETALAGKESGKIIITGGGVVTRTENYAPLHQNGVIFQLERELSRLPIDGRPVSQRTPAAELYRQRAPLYEAFRDFAADNNGTIESIVERIWRIFNENTGD